jgi:hypothetical protein
MKPPARPASTTTTLARDGADFGVKQVNKKLTNFVNDLGVNLGAGT